MSHVDKMENDAFLMRCEAAYLPGLTNFIAVVKLYDPASHIGFHYMLSFAVHRFCVKTEDIALATGLSKDLLDQWSNMSNGGHHPKTQERASTQEALLATLTEQEEFLQLEQSQRMGREPPGYVREFPRLSFEQYS